MKPLLLVAGQTCFRYHQAPHGTQGFTLTSPWVLYLCINTVGLVASGHILGTGAYKPSAPDSYDGGVGLCTALAVFRVKIQKKPPPCGAAPCMHPHRGCVYEEPPSGFVRSGVVCPNIGRTIAEHDKSAACQLDLLSRYVLPNTGCLPLRNLLWAPYAQHPRTSRQYRSSYFFTRNTNRVDALFRACC